MSVASIKEDAHRLIEQLPNEATWDDLIYQIYVRQSIEAGLEESRAGDTVPVEDVRREYGLSP